MINFVEKGCGREGRNDEGKGERKREWEENESYWGIVRFRYGC